MLCRLRPIRNVTLRITAGLLRPRWQPVSNTYKPREKINKPPPDNATVANVASPSTNPATSPQPPSFSQSCLQATLHSLKYALAVVLAFHLTAEYFFAIHETYGISMVPSLSATGDWVLISKWYRRGRGVQVGDAVSFKHPLQGEVRAIKRVVGLQGDYVLRDTPGKGEGVMIQVPRGHCWVVGDNLNHSRDSRMFGPLPMALVKGKVVAVFSWSSLWPRPVLGGLQDALTDGDLADDD